MCYEGKSVPNTLIVMEAGNSCYSFWDYYSKLTLRELTEALFLLPCQLYRPWHGGTVESSALFFFTTRTTITELGLNLEGNSGIGSSLVLQKHRIRWELKVAHSVPRWSRQGRKGVSNIGLMEKFWWLSCNMWDWYKGTNHKSFIVLGLIKKNKPENQLHGKTRTTYILTP